MKERLILCCLKFIAFLPWWMLYGLSDCLAFFLYHILKYRRAVVRKNLVEAFPDKSLTEIKDIEKKYYRYMSDMIVETVKLLNISDKEMAKRAEVIDVDIVNESLDKGISAVVFLGHYGNWEWVQEISRKLSDKALKGSIYHPLKSKLWDSVYLKIRSRWGAYLLPQSKAVRALLRRDNQPWVFGFIADHRSNYGDLHGTVDFLNHPTEFIVGPETIGTKVGAEFFYLDVVRQKRGYYKLIFKKLKPIQGEQFYPYTRAFWHEFEKSIIKNPPYWLWSHKRWKIV
ncbi:MAG: lysophospholipid acyltransferase family protein [Paramuribaculum sp.]|nr:lysophospholipid acyltransferase family protein [Paramuribaculum sp.]